MGYMSINNLYRDTAILAHSRVYALEKIHGTSAHITWQSDRSISFFPGGVGHAEFIRLFDVSTLAQQFLKLQPAGAHRITVYGEAYGGKCQKMANTYGPELRFVAFDVKVTVTDATMTNHSRWLDVPDAYALVTALGLQFVDYVECDATVQALDYERDRPSIQSARNGIDPPGVREGIVIRPLTETTDARGNRLIVKHKTPQFGETATKREVDPDKLRILADAAAIAAEWVTPMRLDHVLDKLGNPSDLSSTGDVVRAMIEDVVRESTGEIVDSRNARSAIGRKAAEMYKARVTTI